MEQKLVAGKIGAPHGVKGWVKVFSYTDPIDNLLNYRPWWLELRGRQQQLVLEEYRMHGGVLLVGFEGVYDRDAASALTHGLIYVDRAQLPQLPEGKYYWADLEELEVVNLEGFCFGRVTYLMSTGANDVMFIKGEQEHCLPYLPEVVKKVDMTTKTITVDWPAELP